MKKLAVIAALALVGTFVFAADNATKPAAPAATAAAPAATAAAAPAAPAAPAVTTLEGTIAKVVAANKAKKTGEELSVVGADGKAVLIAVKPATTITGADGKALAFAKLAAKDKVKVEYTLKGKIAEASSITIVQ